MALSALQTSVKQMPGNHLGQNGAQTGSNKEAAGDLLHPEEFNPGDLLHPEELKLQQETRSRKTIAGNDAVITDQEHQPCALKCQPLQLIAVNQSA